MAPFAYTCSVISSPAFFDASSCMNRDCLAPNSSPPTASSAGTRRSTPSIDAMRFLDAGLVGRSTVLDRRDEEAQRIALASAAVEAQAERGPVIVVLGRQAHRARGDVLERRGLHFHRLVGAIGVYLQRHFVARLHLA